ncbi:hypothetical protein M8818_005762 [Zalaria obscura]|uniref:Uncharacterized protein n=1 Tax=Zalaria obscura TaxID=2024903 RepID=A0ACC3SAP7_9PEZI
MSGETRMQNRTRWDAQRTYLICGRHAVVYLATVIEQRSSTEEAKTAKQAFGATLTRLPEELSSQRTERTERTASTKKIVAVILDRLAAADGRQGLLSTLCGPRLNARKSVIFGSPAVVETLLEISEMHGMARDAATANTPLAPSVEKAYYRKCIELKRRLNEVEDANDAARLRKLRLNRAIMKMRLERAFLLEQLAKRMDGTADEEGDEAESPAETSLYLRYAPTLSLELTSADTSLQPGTVSLSQPKRPRRQRALSGSLNPTHAHPVPIPAIPHSSPYATAEDATGIYGRPTYHLAPKPEYPRAQRQQSVQVGGALDTRGGMGEELDVGTRSEESMENEG